MKFLVARLAEDLEGNLNKQFVSSKGLTGFSDLRKEAQEFGTLQEASATANALEHTERVFSSFCKTRIAVCMTIEEVRE